MTYETIYRALNRLRCCMVQHRVPKGAVNAVTGLCMRAYYRWQYGKKERDGE